MICFVTNNSLVMLWWSQTWENGRFCIRKAIRHKVYVKSDTQNNSLFKSLGNESN